MGCRTNKGLGSLLTLPSRTVGIDGTRKCLSEEAGPVAMRVSSTNTNDIPVAGDCFLILVQIDPTTSASLRIVLHDSSEIDVQCRDGEACVLAPGSVDTQRSKSCGELIHYQVPRQSIRAFADDHAVPPMNSLETPRFTVDPVLHLLSKVVRSLLETDFPASNPDTVTENFIRSFYSHVLGCYGVIDPRPEQFTGGLSPRHRHLVEEALSSPDQPHLGLSSLAMRCGLSMGHFARAFRQTFGVSFHKHLMDMRIQHAKQLLVENVMTLKEIALAIGYADQATFTESFTRSVGTPPGRFRRRYERIDGSLAQVAYIDERFAAR